jgi:hypothetical protein
VREIVGNRAEVEGFHLPPSVLQVVDRDLKNG